MVTTGGVIDVVKTGVIVTWPVSTQPILSATTRIWVIGV